MRIPGFCRRCRKVKQVSVSSRGMVSLATSGVAEGICAECQEEELYAPRISRIEQAIRAHGFTVRYVPYCEDARTPGLLGQIAGVTDRERREVKIATNRRTPRERLDTLEHELRHVRDPEWDCGNRDVFGRGGPAS